MNKIKYILAILPLILLAIFGLGIEIMIYMTILAAVGYSFIWGIWGLLFNE